MTSTRAQTIAKAFSTIRTFSVNSEKRGLYVQYPGRTAYFVREACFWSFIFSLRHTGETQKEISRIESQLMM